MKFICECDFRADTEAGGKKIRICQNTGKNKQVDISVSILSGKKKRISPSVLHFGKRDLKKGFHIQIFIISLMNECY